MTGITRSAAIASYPRLQLFIDGRWLGAEGRATVNVVDPASADILGQLPCAGEADLDRAVSAAERGFKVWRLIPAIERGRLLWRAGQWLRDRREEWAALIALELGKPLAQARIEADTACEMFEWAAEEARRIYGRQIPGRTSAMRMTVIAEPVGPVFAISGWNAPAITPARKISGALGAGCSIVIKPSEGTPACALMIARALEAAELPPGVLNIIYGDPSAIGVRLSTDPAIRMLTFTGATAVGKQLATACSSTLKRVVLELGGYAPALVCDNVDVDQVARSAAMAKFRNAGQVCTSPTRFLVHRRIYDSFVERFTTAMKSIVVGDPFDPLSQMGPLQNARRARAIRDLVVDSTARGARLEVASAPAAEGFWEPPRLLTDVPDGARVRHEEPFGPLALINLFTTIDEAITEANRLPFGLAAYAFTEDLRIAERLQREVQCGTIAINHWTASFPETPFGGIKDSGLGREGGSEGIAEFTSLRFISVAT